MRVLQRGHRYELKNRGKGTGSQIVQYVNREPGMECDGVTQQEVLRMMIDRNRYCTSCLPNSVSERIQYHLRMALVLHEMRALERKVQKGEIEPEYLDLGEDGHFRVTNLDRVTGDDGEDDFETFKLEPYRNEWEKECNHQTAKDKPVFENLDKDDDEPPKLKVKSNKKGSNKRKGKYEDSSEGIILDSRSSLSRFLNRERKDTVKVNVRESTDRVLKYIYTNNPHERNKIEAWASFLYEMYRNRVSGFKPIWNSETMLKDDYYVGIRARGYIDALQLVFDYKERNIEYFMNNVGETIFKPVRIINTKTGEVTNFKKFSYDTAFNSKGKLSEIYIEGPETSDDDIKIKVDNKGRANYRIFVGI